MSQFTIITTESIQAMMKKAQDLMQEDLTEESVALMEAHYDKMMDLVSLVDVPAELDPLLSELERVACDLNDTYEPDFDDEPDYYGMAVAAARCRARNTYCAGW